MSTLASLDNTLLPGSPAIGEGNMCPSEGSAGGIDLPTISDLGSFDKALHVAHMGSAGYCRFGEDMETSTGR